MVNPENITESNKKSSSCFKANIGYFVLVIILLACLGVGIYFLGERFGLFGKMNPSQLVPSDAVFYLEMDLYPDKEQYEKLKELSSRFNMEEKMKEMWEGEFQDSLPGLSFKDDVKLWLGEKIAQAGLASKDKTSLVTLVEIRSKAELERSLIKVGNKVREEGGIVEESRYKSYKLLIFDRKKGKAVFGALVANFIILGDDLESIKRVIDIKTSGIQSLSSSSNFNKAIAKLDNNRLATLYFDINRAESLTGGKVGILEPLELISNGKIELISLGAKVSDAGIVFKGYSFGEQETESFTPNLVSIAPKDNVILYAESADFRQALSMLLNVNSPDNILTKTLGTSFSEELFSLIERQEYSVFISYQVKKVLPSLTLVFNISSDEKAKEALKKLEKPVLDYFSKYLKDKMSLSSGDVVSLSSFQEKDQIRYFEIPGQEITISYTVRNKKLIVSTSRELTSSVVDMVSGDKESLKSHNDYQEVFSQIDTEGISGMGYLNMNTLSSWISDSIMAQLGDLSDLQRKVDMIKVVGFVGIPEEGGTRIEGRILVN
ncbi:hypothetical protein COY23_04100 [bacterium (Candidatus Torokbacteria) CG_4_10_14_0_2_um_filter_35_8]|nr:MAG: hypothetical protein COY23_04100 [bacterium (Candidatus Torokbacteria) CG_4_10_14_0_2_um_filter_35_8]